MESMFVNLMLKAMRKTVPTSELSFENPATKIYQGMLDQEVANRAVRTNSLGLADQIIAYLERRGYNGSQASVHGRTKAGENSAKAGEKGPAE
jgi:Rod binding domain-containing protein